MIKVIIVDDHPVVRRGLFENPAKSITHAMHLIKGYAIILDMR